MKERKYWTLAEAARMVPGRPALSTIHRWAMTGILDRTGNRIRLQTVRVGGRRFIQRDWLTRFIDALSISDDSNGAPAILDPKSKADVACELDQIGI